MTSRLGYSPTDPAMIEDLAPTPRAKGEICFIKYFFTCINSRIQEIFLCILANKSWLGHEKLLY